MSSRERPRPTSDLARDVLRYAPGLAALAVAVLYVAGAVTKVSEVSGAGFSASTVLSDVPIQQLLALGVASLASPVAIEAAAVAMAISIIGGLTWEFFFGKTSTAAVDCDPTAEPEAAPVAGAVSPHVNTVRARNPWRVIKFVASVPIGLVAAWLLVIAVLNLRLDTAANIACFWAVVLLARRRGYPWKMAVPLAYASGLIVGITVFTVVWPSPLQEAVVTTKDGPTTGQLLATTDADVVVGLGDCRIVTIPTDGIVRLLVIPRRHRLVGNIGTSLFGPAVAREKPPIKLIGACGT